MPILSRPTRRTVLAGAAGGLSVGFMGTGAWGQDLPPLDPQSAAVNALVAGGNALPLAQRSLAGIRAGVEDAGQSLQAEPIPVARTVETDVPLANYRTPVRLYYPAAPESETPPIVLYAHGGSFVAGSIDSHDHVARMISQSCGALVASIGYRLAPENPYPAGLDDVSEALRWIADKGDVLGGDKMRIGLMGDGAGGMLVAGATVRFRLTPFEGLKFLGLMTPYLRLDARTDFPSRSQFGNGTYRPSLADLAWMREQYLSLEDDETPAGLVSPLDATRYNGLPNTLVITAGYDAVRDEGGFFVRRLREGGVVAGERRFERTIHNFMFYAPLIPAARLAFDVMALQFKQAIDG